jgi:uncharacterized protein YdaU (DUF1376 family)
MHCWDQKGPAPLDERKLMGICNARSTDEIEAMRRVLAEFFIRMDDGHYNARMQTEVERSEALSRARSDAGRKGYEAKAKHLPSKCQASAKQVPLSPSPSPSPSLSQGQKEKTTPKAAPDGVSDSVWRDFCAVRNKLRAAVTETAIKGIAREAEKAGFTLEAALQMCCERGWRGFRAEWVESLPQSSADVAAEAIRLMEAREARNAQG